MGETNPYRWQPSGVPRARHCSHLGVSPRSPRHPDLVPLTTILAVCEHPRPRLPLLSPGLDTHSGSSVGTDRKPTPSLSPRSGGIGFRFREQSQGKLAPGWDAQTPAGPQKLPSKVRWDPKEPFPWVDNAGRLAGRTVGRLPEGRGRPALGRPCWDRSRQATASFDKQEKNVPR